MDPITADKHNALVPLAFGRGLVTRRANMEFSPEFEILDDG